MTPLSYQGFGFTAILTMVLILAASQLIRFLKEQAHKHKAVEVRKTHKPESRKGPENHK